MLSCRPRLGEASGLRRGSGREAQQGLGGEGMGSRRGWGAADPGKNQSHQRPETQHQYKQQCHLFVDHTDHDKIKWTRVTSQRHDASLRPPLSPRLSERASQWTAGGHRDPLWWSLAQVLSSMALGPLQAWSSASCATSSGCLTSFFM